jgi:hypothetical protein
MPDGLPLHALAQLALSAIVPDGAASAIPPARLQALRSEIKAAHTADRMLFLHLMHLSLQLDDRGLKVAAEQLHTLAQIGIMQARLDESGTVRHAARTADPAFGPTQSTQAAEDAVRKAVRSAGKDPARLLRALVAATQTTDDAYKKRAMYKALKKLLPETDLAGLFGHARDAEERSAFVEGYGVFAPLDAKRALVAAAAAHPAEDQPLLALLLSEPGEKGVAALLESARGHLPRERLAAICGDFPALVRALA